MERKPEESQPYVKPTDASADQTSPTNQASTGAHGRPGRTPATDYSSDMSRRSEIDKIVPGPGHAEEVDELVRERMDEESPDGRPPTLEVRRKSKILFFTAFTVVWLVVLVAVYIMGGLPLAALVLLLTAIYIGYAAWPTWRAALERQGDEKRAEREIEAESVHGAPPDRQPPAQQR